MVQAVEADTAGDLDADAVKTGQKFHRLAAIHPAKLAKRAGMPAEKAAGLFQVRGAVSQLQGAKIGFRGAGQFGGGGKRMAELAPSILQNGGKSRPVKSGERLHGVSDRGNGFLLGDEKGYDHLPGILAQDADAASRRGRFPQIGIVRADGGKKHAVIRVRVEVMAPEGEIPGRAVEKKGILFLPDFGVPASADQTPGAGPPGREPVKAEALAGLRGLRKVEIRNVQYLHRLHYSRFSF